MARLELVELRCPGCGGDLQYTVGAPIANCPYCDASIALVSDTASRTRAIDGHEYRMLPFKTTAENFQNAFLHFLSEGDYTPPDVFEQVKVRQNTGLFAAVYHWTGTARVSWSAESGFDRTETYVKTRTVTRNGSKVTEPTTGTRTVTDWRPITGDLLHDYRVLGLADDGIPDNVAAVVESTESLPALDRLGAVDPAQLKGYALQQFKRPESDAFGRRGQKQLDGEIAVLVKRAVPGDKSRKERFTASRRDERSVRVYRPIWLAVYSYGGESFAFAIDGHTGRGALGTRPEDTAQRERVEALEKNIKNANVAALVCGILSFFVSFIFGPILVGVIWYAYTSGKKKQLAVEKARISAARDVRKARLDSKVSHGTGAGVAPSGSTVLRLLDVGPRKIGVIKVVRELTGLGLKDTKDLVEGAPSVIKEWDSRGQAEDAAKELRELGATVEVSDS